MRKPLLTTLLFFLFTQILLSQPIDSILFFTDEAPLEFTITTDLKALQSQKKPEKFYQDGTVAIKWQDNTIITEPIKVSARGKTRKEICRIPPMMIDFRTSPTSRLNHLGKLKMVIGCGTSQTEEELLLKELLCYKIFNQLSDKSFRVRLLKSTYVDTRNRIKSFSQYAFLIEDDGDVARRNGCHKKETAGHFNSEATNRETMTMVALFEYLIGNTDWSVPNGHNIKLIFDRNKENALPYVLPYDFDYSGLVNAEYAVPADIMGTEKVTERVYRGFPRTMDELQQKLTIYREKKLAIYAVINNFMLLSEKTKKGMIQYLEDFYSTINDTKAVQRIFIDNARIN
ncbi:MAG: hypothetical protein RIR12_164 [Bacteroidota bacterium]|jgi:hypothetical protein